MKVCETIDVVNTLGEGPVWDDRLGRLWWTDIQAARLYHWDWDSRVAAFTELPERLGSLGLTSDPSVLVCAFASGFALFQPKTGHCEWLHKTEPNYRGIRMNDGRVDRQGRFWCGSMVEDADQASGATGSLYRLDPDDGVTNLFDGISIANSTCFAPDGTVAYFADTPTGRIESFTLTPDGEIGEWRLFSDAPLGGPDGSEVDSLGRLWNAEWGSSRLSCYDPDGTQAQHFSLPVSRPTCPTFGGPDLDHMFVTTSRLELDEEELELEPDAGKVLILRAPCKGLPASRYPLQGHSSTARLSVDG